MTAHKFIFCKIAFQPQKAEPPPLKWSSPLVRTALLGHYRYNHWMFGHFMQDNLQAQERGIFMAGDGVSIR